MGHHRGKLSAAEKYQVEGVFFFLEIGNSISYFGELHPSSNCLICGGSGLGSAETW